MQVPEYVPPKVAAKLLGRHLSSIYRTIRAERVETRRMRDGIVVHFRSLADADAKRRPGRPAADPDPSPDREDRP